MDPLFFMLGSRHLVMSDEKKMIGSGMLSVTKSPWFWFLVLSPPGLFDSSSKLNAVTEVM
jgi:hypothetical protein